MIDALAHRRHVPREQRRQSPQRVHVPLRQRQPPVDDGAPLVQLDACVRFPRAAVQRQEQRHGCLVMLVLDRADDLLDQVLDRDEPLRARILVQHDRQVHAAGPHVGEQVQRGPGHRHVERLADQPGDGRGPLGAGRQDLEHVLEVDHADDRIERAAIDGQTAVPGVGERGDQRVEAGPLLHRNDVRARHADVARILLAEMKEVTHHAALQRRKVALLVGRGIALVPVDRAFQLVAQLVLGRRGAEQPLQTAPQPSSLAAFATSILRHPRPPDKGRRRPARRARPARSPPCPPPRRPPDGHSPAGAARHAPPDE